MARAGSRHGSSRGPFLDLIDRVTAFGLQVGGPLFIIAAGYLLWGILSGSLAGFAALPQADRDRIAGNVLLACKVLTGSGVVALLSAAARYYHEELTGYLFLILGALSYWGMPVAAASSLKGVTLDSASLVVYTIGQFRLIGIVALGASAPFILADIGLKLTGARRSAPRGAVVVSKEGRPPKKGFYTACWQMPYCRDYLRKFCDAYRQRKTCWRIKSGCYCDEGMILRALKSGGSGRVAGFDQKFSQTWVKARDLTPAQKRQRCRECFLYSEHQKQKYHILSPIAILAAVAVMWAYLTPVQRLLRGLLASVDRFADRVSFLPGTNVQVGNEWANAPGISGMVEWLFVICLGLILTSYLLRALEYLIFDVKI